jgi:hypothetical protein
MIHKLMAHPHVVPFREAFEDEDQVYILLGLCEYGVRHQTLTSPGPPLRPRFCRT